MITIGGVAVAVVVVGGAAFMLGAPPQPEQKAPAAAPAPAPAPKMSEMDKLIEAAKNEGRIVIYLDGTPGRILEGKLDKSFTEKYGIEVKYVAGRGTSLIRKYEEEVKAGKPIADVVAFTSDPMLYGQEKGLFQEYASPELPNFQKQDFKDMIFYGSSISSTIAWNTNLMKKEDVPTTYAELTDPKWKGKIITPMGTTQAYYHVKLQGEDWLRAMKTNELKVNPSFTASRELLSTGAFPLLIGMSMGSLLNVMQQGQPIEFIITEPAYGSGRVIALSKTAPHPNAGRLYIDWFLSRETLKQYWEVYPQISFRSDTVVDEPHLDPVKSYVWDTDPEIFAGQSTGARDARQLAWGIFGITRRR